MNSSTRAQRGFTLIEILVAILLSSVIAASGFDFYKSMHGVTSSQEEVTEMQQNTRASIDEISRTLRMAGYKLPAGHDAYYLSDDTLIAYYSNSNPVDTVIFYLEVQPGTESYPDNWKPYRLMRKVNSAAPAIYADNIRSLNYTLIDSSKIEIALVAQTSKSDVTKTDDEGFRSFSMMEQVVMRNVSL